MDDLDLVLIRLTDLLSKITDPGRYDEGQRRGVTRAIQEVEKVKSGG